MSKLDEDFPPIERISHQPVEHHEREGIGERCPLGRRHHGVDGIEDEVVDAEMAEDDGQQFAQDVEEQRVHAEDEEEGGETAFLPILLQEGGRLFQLDDDDQQDDGQSAGGEHIRGTPDALVQRQPDGQCEAGDGQPDAVGEQGSRLLVGVMAFADDLSAEESNHGVGDGGQRAKQAFRVDGTFMIEVVVAEEPQVDLCQDVRRRVVGVAVSEKDDEGIDDKQGDYRGDGVDVSGRDGKQRDGQIAQGDALHDGPQAQVAKAEHVARDGMVEPVDAQADEEQQRGALEDLPQHDGGGPELRLLQRQIGGDAHHEEEEGKDKVAEGHAVPLRVLQLAERLAVAVVHHDHHRHGQSAHHVERHQALAVLSRCSVHALSFCCLLVLPYCSWRRYFLHISCAMLMASPSGLAE